MEFTPERTIIFNWFIAIGSLAVALVAIRKGWLNFKKPIIQFRDWCRDMISGTAGIRKEINNIRVDQTAFQGKVIETLNRMETNQVLNQRVQAENSAGMNTLLNMIGTNVFKFDLDGNWTFVNDNLCNLTGMQFEDFLDNGWKNFIAPSDRERVVKEIYHSVKDRRVVTVDFNLIHRDGKYRHVILRTEKIACAKKINFGFIGSILVIENATN